MTVTTQRIEYVVSAVTALDNANFRARRAQLSASGVLPDELLEDLRRCTQDVVDLDVSESEVAEIAAAYEPAARAYQAAVAAEGRQPTEFEATAYRDLGRRLTWFRRAYRLAQEAAGHRTPGVSVTGAGVTVHDFADQPED